MHVEWCLLRGCVFIGVSNFNDLTCSLIALAFACLGLTCVESVFACVGV